jgi:hypothetical protein
MFLTMQQKKQVISMTMGRYILYPHIQIKKDYRSLKSLIEKPDPVFIKITLLSMTIGRCCLYVLLIHNFVSFVSALFLCILELYLYKKVII